MYSEAAINSNFYDDQVVPASIEYSHNPIRRQVSWNLCQRYLGA